MANTARQLVHIVSEMNRKVLTIKDGLNQPGAPVVMWTASSQPLMNQLWYEDDNGVLRSAMNDFALEGRFSGDQFVVMPFSETNPHQRWVFHGNKISKVNLPPDCVDIDGADDKDGAQVIVFPYSGTSNQQWHVENIKQV